MTPPPVVTEMRSALPAVDAPAPVPGRAHPLDPRWWPRARFFVDAAVLLAATAAAVLGPASLVLNIGSRLVAAAFPLLVICLLHVRRSADDRLSPSALDIVWHVAGATSLAAMLAVAADSVLGVPHPLALPLRLWVFGLVYLAIARLVLRSVRHQAFAFDAFSSPTIIVGAGLIGRQLIRRLQADRSYGLRPIGLIDADPLPQVNALEDSGIPVLGGLGDLVEAVISTGARQLILAFSSDPDRLMIEKIEECRRMGVSVLLVPRLYELMNERSTLDHVGGLPVLALRSTNPSSWEFEVKHAFDRLVAATAVILLSPLMAAIALLIWLSSPGPVLFRQSRVGRDGHEFEVLKFRTMRGDPVRDGEADAHWIAEQIAREDGSAPKLLPVDRRTPIGRFLRRSSLDEIPQLINVLRGDMSLVGPRPERPAYVQRFTTEVDRYDRRHRVKSGITGWAQVRGLRGQTSISDRVEWDNFYIQNWSLWLDLKILAMTFTEVFRFRG
jgi:exopolysaccharide biosynthesis polyprenyl glycosylphosphotransferase